MNYVWLALIGGAAAFPHCLGMCGGFALHLAGGTNRGSVLIRQLLWHAGRTITYVFLGALAGYFGAMVFSLARWPWTRALAGYIVGIVMILMGLALLGFLSSRLIKASSAEKESLFTAIFRQFFSQPTAVSALALGVATGFLPCPVTVGFLALAAQTKSVVWGMAIMAAMGLGTVWGLLLLGMTGHMLSLKWRRRGAVTLGILLIALGTWTLLRKAGVLPALPGGPTHAQSGETRTLRPQVMPSTADQ
jgi:sulfite exporter TauE/SafE